MAAEGAVHIKGGNYQLFEQFLNHSGANVYLNTSVRFQHVMMPTTFIIT